MGTGGSAHVMHLVDLWGLVPKAAPIIWDYGQLHLTEAQLWQFKQTGTERQRWEEATPEDVSGISDSPPPNHLSLDLTATKWLPPLQASHPHSNRERERGNG